MLDLIEIALRVNGYRFTRLDGSMSSQKRNKAIDEFRGEPDCTVLLASLGSAGVGIDLTVACRVHLMEPQWNPMVEEQALDRVYRLGQKRPVIDFRYVIKGSIEEYVVNVKERKTSVIQRSLGSDGNKSEKSRLQQLQDLHDFLTLNTEELQLP